MTNRRAFMLGFGAALAAPAVVRAESIMRIAAPRLIVPPPMLLDFPIPIGSIISFAQPDGILEMRMFTGNDFIECVGQTVRRETYSELFRVIGMFQTDDEGSIGPDELAIPDLRPRKLI